MRDRRYRQAQSRGQRGSEAGTPAPINFQPQDSVGSSEGARRYQIPEGLAGERVDVAVARLTGLSRTKAANAIDAGQVSVDGVAVTRSERLQAASELEVGAAALAPPAAREPEPVVPIPVLFEDASLVVVDKPAGVAAHPSPSWDGPTVTGCLAVAGVQLPSAGAAEREGVVHRLDVGTSGVMVVAKTLGAYSALKHQFKARTVDKVYQALVQGHPDPSSGTIDAPLARHPHHSFRFAVVAGGRPSVTHYRTLEAFPRATLLEVRLETGRTHQIRVHFSAARHPCCGDSMYGADPRLADELGLARQWLQAVRLEIDHPLTGERIAFESDCPVDLAEALEVCRGW